MCCIFEGGGARSLINGKREGALADILETESDRPRQKTAAKEGVQQSVVEFPNSQSGWMAGGG